ncbi:unnamed protein product [Mytilus coruscus]|uniref:Uncharacterized protein n=1 Tax=Mytilus coruscus TaxID=42192 RepID=A0A6J8B2I7_MYTCO|nr:unnamed protein product [Mytilus coruscus]
MMKKDLFKLRYKIFDENIGHYAYQTLYFAITVEELRRRSSNGYKCNVNIDSKTMSFERTSKAGNKETIDCGNKGTQTNNSPIYQVLPNVIDTLEEMGRLEDFVSLLHCIFNKTITESTALNLILDVGQFYRQSTISNMRYNEESIAFWVTVKKIIQGKGINFFRGYKGEGHLVPADGRLLPIDCRINFAVPSNPILAKETSKYTNDASRPGLLSVTLDTFAKENRDKEVKLSIDGKKLAIGFGEMGDGDLSGFESKPTRKDWIKEEQIT